MGEVRIFKSNAPAVASDRAWAEDRHMAELVTGVGGSRGARIVLEPGDDAPVPAEEGD